MHDHDAKQDWTQLEGSVLQKVVHLWHMFPLCSALDCTARARREMHGSVNELRDVTILKYRDIEFFNVGNLVYM